MKKFLLALIFLTITSTAGLCTPQYSDISENSSVYYSPETKKWSATPQNSYIKFTKQLTAGENKFSEYCSDGLRYDSNSSKEFFFNGDLIGYNKNTMKFHRIYFEDGTFTEEKLNEKELSEIFPDCEIIRISQFKDNSIKLKRSPFKQKTYLMMNDTNLTFFNYKFQDFDNSSEGFNCIFTPKKSGVYRFVPQERGIAYPPYTIQLRYVL